MPYSNSSKILYPLLVALIITTSSCLSTMPKSECKKYKTGKYEYRSKDPKNPFVIRIFRNDSIQTEISRNSGDTAILKVTWLDECTYKLTFIDVKNSMQGVKKMFDKKNEITTTIVDGTNEYYIYRSKYSLTNNIITDTMWAM